MADYADRAAVVADQHLKAALANARPRTCGGSETIYCRQCDVKIPKVRRDAVPGCSLCVVCQQNLENQGG